MTHVLCLQVKDKENLISDDNGLPKVSQSGLINQIN